LPFDLVLAPPPIGSTEACSAFTRVTACTLALSPYIVTP